MTDNHEVANRPLAAASTGELLTDLASQSKELLRKELELAKAELRKDVKHEVKMAAGIGVGAVCFFTTLNLVLVAVALALPGLPPWAAMLIVASVVLIVGLIAAWVGWTQRSKHPLAKTEKTLKEDVQWAKRLT